MRIEEYLVELRHYLKGEIKATKIRVLYKNMPLKYIYIYMYMSNEKQKQSSTMQNLSDQLFKIRFPKGGLTYRRQVVNPRNQTPQGQSVAKHEEAL